MNTTECNYNSESEDNNSIYKLSSELTEKGYAYSNDGVFCPLEDKYYLKIGRTDKKYSYSIVKYEDYEFKYISYQQLQ